MSFILDALKKSEAERQRQNTPGIADVVEGSEPTSTPRWIWILVALLGINLLVLAVVLLRPEPPPARIETTRLQVPARENAVDSAVDDAANPSAVDDAAGESASFSDMVTEAKQRQPDPEPVSEAPQQAVRAAETTSAAPQSAATSETRTEPTVPSTLTTAYPTFNEVRAAGTVQLPDLHLDIHVYSEQQADRFVFVNMSKYTEHTSLSEGPMVREIVPEGVILEHRGTEFLLPRQ